MQVRVKGTDVSNYRLHVYAPGDGALALTWVNKINNQSDGHLIVTKEDADDHLSKQNNNDSVFIINGQVRIVRDIKRVNENTLERNGEQYSYTLTEAGKQMLAQNESHLPHYCVSYTYQYNNETHKLQNWSMIASLSFFLVNEKTLTQTPQNA